MICSLAGNRQHLDGSSRLPGSAPNRIEECLFVDESGAGARQENTSRCDGLERQPIHVEILFQCRLKGLSIGSSWRGRE